MAETPRDAAPTEPDPPEPLRSAPGGAAADILAGWLVVLPFAALAWPGAGGLFRDAPDTVSIGVGASALAAIPALALAALRGRGGRVFGLALLVIVLAFAGFQAPRAADGFNAWRALVGLAAAFGWTVAGASLGGYGRRVVARGFPLVALLLVVSAPWTEGGTGTFGNSGDLSEAALPGAVLGAGVFLTAPGGLRFVGLVALAGFAIFAGLVPVWAGLASLGAATLAAGCAAWVGRSGGVEGRREAGRRFRVLFAGLAVGAAPLAFGAWLGHEAAPDPAADPAAAAEDAFAPAAPPRTTTGGIEFRRLTWTRLPDLVLDHAQLGVGPGQFQAAFPPYRDPAEIELSSFARREPTPIEVEHAHSDWMTIPAEYGAFAGGLFLAFLLLALLRSARALAGPDDGGAMARDFALAAIAVLANAAVNSNLLYGVASPLAAFVVMGVVLSREDESDERGALDRAVPGISLAVLVLLAPRALSYVEYGRVLAEVREARIVVDGREKLDPAALGTILERAAALHPDSVALLEQRALLERRDEQRRASLGAGELGTGEVGPTEAQRQTLRDWLARRPHSVAALLNAGALEVRARRLDDALAWFSSAAALDPENPSVLRNLVRLGCERRAPDEVSAALDALVSVGRASPEFLRGAALATMLEGRLDVARPLVARWSAESGAGPIDVRDVNAIYAAQRAAEDAGDEDASLAWRNAFRLRVGQDHMESGAPEQAITQFRLAYQSARDAGRETSALRLHLAAAQSAAGQTAAALEIAGLGPLRAEDRAGLTEAERAALAALDLGPGSAALSPR